MLGKVLEAEGTTEKEGDEKEGKGGRGRTK